MEKRITIAFYIVIFLFGVFIFRLWDLQIIKGGEYKKIDERNRLRVIDIPAPRGIIYDRNDRPLVKNIPSFDISVVKEDIPKDPETLSMLARLIGLKTDDIKEILDRSLTIPFEPVKLKQDVPLKEVAKVEARRIDFPGLQIEVVDGREYIYNHSASHVIGYLGRMSVGQMRSPKFADIPRKSFVGQFGIEKVYDGTLRGIAGKKIIEVDALGSIIKVVRTHRPVKGDDIRLTIDIDIQVVAEKNLRGKAGAVVALKPDTGEILALASAPSFDPNLFVRGIDYKDWDKLVKDKKKPMLNRAIQSQYPPGSTFKIITAIAALEQGIVTKNTEYNCNGSIYYGRIFRCWKWDGHGNVRLHRALVESCDVYFYEIAKNLHIDTLSRYARDFGLGRRVGVELEGEVSGIVPDTLWKRNRKHEKWYTGETINTVIGQGYLTTTPMQMARLMAAVANNGKLYKPYLLMDLTADLKAESVVTIKPENISLIKKALLGVVTDKRGTGGLSRSDIVNISGKTGTTQVVRGDIGKEEDIPEKFKDHAWFVAFAPEDNPQIAVAIFVEHGGHGSTGAAPIAKRIIETYFEQAQNTGNQNDT
jgi:penicillin-binding protein 2